MISQQLIASIKSDIKDGESLDSIKKFLIESNVDLETINEALSIIAKEEFDLIEEKKDSLTKKQNFTLSEKDIDTINYDNTQKDYSVKLIDNEIFKYESKKLISHKFKSNDIIPRDNFIENTNNPKSYNPKTFLIIFIVLFMIIIIIFTFMYFYL